MTPAELARRAGVSTDTLRYYERKGALHPPARTAGGYRRYTDDDLARVLLVRRALAVGFSVADLARVLAERDRGGAPCRHVHALVRGRLEAVDRELVSLAELKRDLERLLAEWDARLARTPRGEQARLLEALPADRPARTASRKPPAGARRTP